MFQTNTIPETSTNNSHVISGGSKNNAELLETAESKSLLNEINSASLQNSTAVTQNLTNNLTNNKVNSMFQTNQTNTIPGTSNNTASATVSNTEGNEESQEDLELDALKAQIEVLTNRLPPEHRAQMTEESLNKLPPAQLEKIGTNCFNKLPPGRRAHMTKKGLKELTKKEQVECVDDIVKVNPAVSLSVSQTKEISELTEFIRINYDVSSHADSIIKIRDKAKASLNTEWIYPNYNVNTLDSYLAESQSIIINYYRKKPITAKEILGAVKNLSLYTVGGIFFGGTLGYFTKVTSPVAKLSEITTPILGVSAEAGKVISGGPVGAGFGLLLGSSIFFLNLCAVDENLPPELKTDKFLQNLKLAFLWDFGLKDKFLSTYKNIHVLAWIRNFVTCVQTIARSEVEVHTNVIKEKSRGGYVLLAQIISEVTNLFSPPFFTTKKVDSLPPKTLLAAQQLYCMILYLLKENTLFLPIGVEFPVEGKIAAYSKLPVPGLTREEVEIITEELKSLIFSYIVTSYEVGKKEAECSPSTVIYAGKAEQREAETANLGYASN